MPIPSAVGTAGWFAHGSSAVPFTVVTADWCNAVQGEIVNVITAAGLVLDKTRQDQMLLSLNRMYAKTTDLANYATKADLVPYATDADLTNYVKKSDLSQQPALGFTPVQQGGGKGQSNNKVYLGWDGAGLKLQVDVTDLGRLVRLAELGFSAATNGYQKLPSGFVIQWQYVGAKGSVGSSTTNVFNLPLAFPNKNLFAIANYSGTTPPGSTSNPGISAQPQSLTQVSVSVGSGTPFTFGVVVLSIGY